MDYFNSLQTLPCGSMPLAIRRYCTLGHLQRASHDVQMFDRDRLIEYSANHLIFEHSVVSEIEQILVRSPSIPDGMIQ
jgi:hypothetical protein